MLDFKIENKDEITVITVTGEFSYDSADYAKKMLDINSLNHGTAIALNCKNLSFIDSVGIGHLARLKKNTKKLGIDLILYDLNEMILSLFKIARLEDFFMIFTKDDFEKKYLS